MRAYTFTSIKKAMYEIRHSQATNLEEYWTVLEDELNKEETGDTLDAKNERIIALNTKISRIKSIIDGD